MLSGRPLFSAIRGDLAVMKAIQAALIRADPEMAFTIRIESGDHIAGKSIARRQGAELVVIESRESAKRGNPRCLGGVFDYRADQVIPAMVSGITGKAPILQVRKAAAGADRKDGSEAAYSERTKSSRGHRLRCRQIHDRSGVCSGRPAFPPTHFQTHRFPARARCRSTIHSSL